ncbi:PiggyBac transposable element-derived protein 3 [Plakobranchus ocellatus]|uniref:PiggyBac transposable element-derived protein 3 n=1 Tax=Plakobranchus ocellatus TaxID=259542 RepID=A0AAV3YA67_9GAST|nr:PiggyBac transposable element-derived protein 3 [Plakobranchus ocellatus]
MAPNYGRHGAKQFICGKPIRYGFKLLNDIKNKGYDATGTLRANRLNQCPLERVDNKKKIKRGSMDHILNPHENMILLSWNDNSVVTLGSTKHGITPLKNVQRFSQSERRHIQVPCPVAVIQYNKHMGGTDRTDQNIANYRQHPHKVMVVAIVYVLSKHIHT